MGNKNRAGREAKKPKKSAKAKAVPAPTSIIPTTAPRPTEPPK